MNLWEGLTCVGLSPWTDHLTKKVQIHLGVTTNTVALPTNRIAWKFNFN